MKEGIILKDSKELMTKGKEGSEHLRQELWTEKRRREETRKQTKKEGNI